MADLSTLYDAPSSLAASPSGAPVQPAPSAAERLYGSPAPQVVTPEAAPASAASRLYGGPAVEPTPPAAPTTQQAPTAAPVQPEQALYGEEMLPAIEVPENIRAMREADGLRQLYSPQGTYASVLPDDLWAGDDAAKEVPEALQRAAIAELREMAADVGMSADDVRAFDAISRTVTEMPSEEERITWREQAVTRLNEAFGDGAAQALRDARAFIAQDPRRAQFLETNSLGDHPDVVMQVARLARQARAQGKLK